MIIISSRKFRDSQSEYFRKALNEEVILTTVHYGCFRLVPVVEGEPRKETVIVREVSRPIEADIQEVTEEKKKTVVTGTEIAAVRNDVTGEDQAKVMDHAVEEIPISRPIQVSDTRVFVEDTVVNEDVKTDVETKEPAKPKTSSTNVYVDPALYDAFPEEYAAELEAERKMIEELKYTGIRKLLHKIGKR